MKYFMKIVFFLNIRLHDYPSINNANSDLKLNLSICFDERIL